MTQSGFKGKKAGNQQPQQTESKILFKVIDFYVRRQCMHGFVAASRFKL